MLNSVRKLVVNIVSFVLGQGYQDIVNETLASRYLITLILISDSSSAGAVDCCKAFLVP